MPSERLQRRIDKLLDQAELAADESRWADMLAHAESVLEIDPANADAAGFVAIAERHLSGEHVISSVRSDAAAEPPPLPSAFVSGRYQVQALLGEGARKVVYRAHDKRLDRDVAFALIKTAGLDADGRARVQREAQAMGRLGGHPHIVTIHDIGEEAGQLYFVSEYMPGGDLEHELRDADEHRLPIERALAIAEQVSEGLAHAHAQGIVHRDLKPGNIWLSKDGDARLGDFGLAFAADASRLTAAGSLVGTAAYMAPEQATGLPVDARTDLYALGCVIYECITGRPPFIGDDPVAVIAQHLNTDPVAPSWHRADCPPDLEALILQLLAKDPGARPGSAVAVARALDALTLDAAPARSEMTPGPSPVYRRTFVGRESELAECQAAFDAALSGDGGLVMIAGEPGIGKTALTQQLSTYVALRGGRTLLGHCYEEGSLSLPYLPFVEALRGYVIERDPEALSAELGSGAGDVARIVSEIRDRLLIEPSPSTSPDEDRYRLLDAVTTFLRAASEDRPLCLVLEDLHDADRGTLDLLQHVARHLAGARILVVGTYRDVEVDRVHPLSAALAELRRTGPFLRTTLRGLTIAEVDRMLTNIAGQPAPGRWARTIQRQTEGNPLFVQEVFRYLVEEGLVRHEDGRWTGGINSLGRQIPEGLRDVIGKRLARISDAAQTVLGVAAVVGRDFELTILHAVSEETEEAVLEAIQEASDTALVEVRSELGGVWYRFTHAFIRQTLYEELIAPRRIRLHRQIAGAIELVHSGRIAVHAAELAEHYSRSSDPADLAKAVSYGEQAARDASAVFAFGEAQRLLEQALNVQRVLDPGDEARCGELLMALGEAQRRAGEPTAAMESFQQAAAIARALGAPEAVAQAALGFEDAYLVSGQARAAVDDPSVRLQEEALSALPPDDSALRARVLAALAQAVHFQGNQAQGAETSQAALEMARRVGDQDALLAALHARRIAMWGPGDVENRLEVATDLMQLADELGNGELAMDGRQWRIFALFELGRIDDVLTEIDSYEAAAIELRQPALRIYPPMFRGALALAQGRFDDAERAIDEEAQFGLAAESQIAVLCTSAERLERGRELGIDPDTIETHHRLAEEHPQIHTFRSDVAHALAVAGRTDDARAALERGAPHAASLPHDGNWVATVIGYARTAFLLRDVRWANALLGLLAPSRCYCGAGGPPSNTWGPVSRYMGELAVILERWDEALIDLDRALEMAQAMDARPHVAHIHYASALALAGRGAPDDRANAAAHAAEALEIAQALRMQPLVERVLALRTRLLSGRASTPAATVDRNAETIDGPKPGADGAAP